MLPFPPALYSLRAAQRPLKIVFRDLPFTMLRRAHHELQTRYSMLSVQAQLTETTLTEAAQAAVTNNNDLRQQLATLVRL